MTITQVPAPSRRRRFQAWLAAAVAALRRQVARHGEQVEQVKAAARNGVDWARRAGESAASDDIVAVWLRSFLVGFAVKLMATAPA